MRNSVLLALSLFVCTLSVALPARAQDHDLAAVLPRESLIYVGWSGADAWRAIGKDTALGKLMSEPQVQRCKSLLYGELDTFLKGVFQREQAPLPYEPLRGVLQALWRYPSALSILDVAFGEEGPDIQIALVVRAGEHSAEFLEHFEALFQAVAAPPVDIDLGAGRKCKQIVLAPILPPIVYATVGRYAVVAAGRHTFAKVSTALEQGPHLVDNAEFAAARRTAGVEGKALVKNIYLDVPGLLQRFEQIYPALTGADAEDMRGINSVIEAMGLDAMRSISIAVQVQDEGHRVSILVDNKAGRKMPLAQSGHRPITDEDLKVVPLDASFLAAANFNLSAMYDAIVGSSAAPPADTPQGQAEPRNAEPEPDGKAQGFGEMGEALQAVEKAVGFKLKADFLDAFGDTLVVFNAPSNGGLIFTGLTLVAETNDAAKLQAGLEKIVTRIGELAGEKTVTLKSFQHGKRKINFVNSVGLPIPVAPAWSFHGRRLIMGLYPQMVIAALDRLDAADPARTILANQDFLAVRKHIPSGASAVSYVDMKKGVADLYALVLPVVQVLTAMGQGEGLNLDISIMPSVDVLTRHQFGHVSGSYNTEDHWMWVGYGPLPVSVPSVGSGSFGATAMIVAILLPSLARAKEISKRTVSAANLRALGSAIFIYQADHQEALPPSLQALVELGLIVESLLHSPLDESNDISYVLITDQNGEPDPRDVLAHERPDISEEGLNVLFGDGHVEWLDHDEFQKRLAQTHKRIEMRKKGSDPGDD